jgi:predicted DNA-binding antitoxin AbrB/MazE fold protein
MPQGEQIMAITVEAVYENGTLKLKDPLPLKEHETVLVTVEPALTWAERTAGMLPWTGDPEVLHQIATDPDYGILESP